MHFSLFSGTSPKYFDTARTAGVFPPGTPIEDIVRERLGPDVTISNLRADAYKTSKWACGSTTQLAIFPQDAQFQEKNFLARVSTAGITDSGPFTKLEGYTRMLMLLSGDGMKLSFSDGRRCILREAFEKIRFNGGVETTCELCGDSVRDFNLMLAPGADGDIFVYEIGKENFSLDLPGVPVELVKQGNIVRAATVIHAFSAEVDCEVGGHSQIAKLGYGDSMKIEMPVVRGREGEVFIRSSSTPRATIVVARLWFLDQGK